MAHQIDEAEQRLLMIIDNLMQVNPDLKRDADFGYWADSGIARRWYEKSETRNYSHVSCRVKDERRGFLIQVECWANGKTNIGFNTFYVGVGNWSENLVAELIAVVRKHIP